MNYEIIRDASGRILAKVRVARRFNERALGLLRLPKLGAGEGLLIGSCNSVHTFFMRYTIDVVFLSNSLKVISVAPRLAPWRCAASLKAGMALELPAGAAEELRLLPGMQLQRGSL